MAINDREDMATAWKDGAVPLVAEFRRGRALRPSSFAGPAWTASHHQCIGLFEASLQPSHNWLFEHQSSLEKPLWVPYTVLDSTVYGAYNFGQPLSGILLGVLARFACAGTEN